jgi:hypothetical protein
MTGRTRSIEKFNGLIGNRTRDLPAFSIVPQPSTLPHVSIYVYTKQFKVFKRDCLDVLLYSDGVTLCSVL